MAWKWASAEPLAIRQRTKQGRLALYVGVRSNTLELLFEREVEEKICQKGRPDLGRKASQDGHETRPVVLGGYEVKISKLRARTADRKEVVLESYKTVKNDEILTRHVLETMLCGLSTHNYAFGLEDVGGAEAYGTSKSSISRGSARTTRKASAELMAGSPDRSDMVILWIDGIVVTEHVSLYHRCFA